MLGNLVPRLARLAALGLVAMNQNRKILVVIPNVRIVMVNRQFPLALGFPFRKYHPGRAQPKHLNKMVMRATTGSHNLEIRRDDMQPLNPVRQCLGVPVENPFRMLLGNHQPSIEIGLREEVAALVETHQLNLALDDKRLLNQIRHANCRLGLLNQFKIVPSALADIREKTFGPSSITPNLSVRTIRNLARHPMRTRATVFGKRASVARRKRKDCSVTGKLGITKRISVCQS